MVREVNILRELDHPNITKYIERVIDKDKGKIYIIMEYCSGGDLGAFVKNCRRKSEMIKEDVVWKILMQLSLAL